MSADDTFIFDGLRAIGRVRDRGRRFQAWSEPGPETHGTFPTYQDAARAIYDNDQKERPYDLPRGRPR